MKARGIFLLAVVVYFAADGAAQNNFVYTNNDTIPNTVTGFAVGEDGTLTEVPGSPFLTGGDGTPDTGGWVFASNRIRVSTFLYASNRSTNDVSGFSIDPESGALTPVPGSPFPTGGFTDAGMSLVMAPDGRFLYAGHDWSSDIRVFRIGSEGELTSVGDLVPAGNPRELVPGMAVSPDGKWLAVAVSRHGPHGSVAIFGIDTETGEIAPVKGSPFAVREPGGPPGVAAGLDINCTSDTLFVGEANFDTTVVDVLSIDAATGALTPIKGSPFIPGVGENSNVPLLSPDDSLLFVSNQFSHSLTVFNVSREGLTLVPGSPFPTPSGLPSGMATDLEGKFLYNTSYSPNGVSGFSVSSGGVLTLVPGSPFLTGRNGGLFSLAAYPPKTCVTKGN